MFNPCDVDDALEKLDELVFEYTDRIEFKEMFSRATISKNMVVDFLQLKK